MVTTKTQRLGTLYKMIDRAIDPVALFETLNKKTDSFLLESADIIDKYGDKSIGCVDPCLKIIIKDNIFEIDALNAQGKEFLNLIKDDFPYAKELKKYSDKIRGMLQKETVLKDEETRLREKDAFEVLRTLAFKFVPGIKLPIPFCGMFGVISYDAIDYIENLPKQKKMDNEFPDIVFYYATNLFVIDHIKGKTYLISNYLIKNQKSNLENNNINYNQTILEYQEAFDKVEKSNRDEVYDSIKNEKKVETISDNEYIEIVKKVKEHISQGDIFQCVISRNFKINVDEKHLKIYNRLKKINPGPYMFYFKNKDYTLLGSSPETCLKVFGGNEKIVEIKPIAGTLPRGKNGNLIDLELDSRLELELLLNEKELAEHCMLVDLGRNDIAKVSEPMTRIASKLLKVEKFSHVQHLVSCIQGKLRNGLDAIHAYKATMNMGTLTGAPKIKAMELIRKYEKEKRGFYGGAVCYITPFGEFDSCIVIRAISIINNIAEVRAGAGIVFDSDPEFEAEETKNKASACLEALGGRL